MIVSERLRKILSSLITKDDIGIDEVKFIEVFGAQLWVHTMNGLNALHITPINK